MQDGAASDADALWAGAAQLAVVQQQGALREDELQRQLRHLRAELEAAREVQASARRVRVGAVRCADGGDVAA